MSGHVTFESIQDLLPGWNLKSHRSKFQERANLLHDECQKLQQHTQNFTTHWPNTRLSFHEIPGCWGRMSRSTGQISTTGLRTAVRPESSKKVSYLACPETQKLKRFIMVYPLERVSPGAFQINSISHGGNGIPVQASDELIILVPSHNQVTGI